MQKLQEILKCQPGFAGSVKKDEIYEGDVRCYENTVIAGLV